MRLEELLGRPPKKDYTQVEGFLLNKIGNAGQSVNISVGKVGINYFCKNCDDLRTFYSKDKLSVIFINKKMISIDCVLTCGCGVSVPVWFLIESKNDITGQAPELRIFKKCEQMIGVNLGCNSQYNEYKELLDKSELAYNAGLGAGAIVYLRKVYEKITVKTADAVGIEYNKYDNGNPRNFSELLEKVDNKCAIIPKEFSEERKILFQELSNVVHGDNDEEEGLTKFDSLYRLIIGIIENIQNHKEIMQAKEKLNWKSSKENKYE